MSKDGLFFNEYWGYTETFDRMVKEAVEKVFVKEITEKFFIKDMLKTEDGRWIIKWERRYFVKLDQKANSHKEKE